MFTTQTPASSGGTVGGATPHTTGVELGLLAQMDGQLSCEAVTEEVIGMACKGKGGKAKPKSGTKTNKR